MFVLVACRFLFFLTGILLFCFFKFIFFFFFFQAEDGIRDDLVTGVQTCALPIFSTLPLRSTTGMPAAFEVDAGSIGTEASTFAIASVTPASLVITTSVLPLVCVPVTRRR